MPGVQVRGDIWSNWTRGAVGERELLRLSVQLPLLAAAQLTLPLLGRAPEAVRVTRAARGGTPGGVVWDGHRAPASHAAQLVEAPDGAVELRLTLAGGRHAFVLTED